MKLIRCLSRKVWIFKNKFYLRNDLKINRQNYNMLLYLFEIKQGIYEKSNYVHGISMFKHKSLSGKERIIFGKDIDNQKLMFKLTYDELFKLSVFSKSCLMSQKELIEYLNILNRNVLEQEKDLDDEIIKAFSIYKNGFYNMTLKKFVYKSIDFFKYKTNYNKAQLELKHFMRYFIKHARKKNKDKFITKVEIYEWDDMFSKIMQNLSKPSSTSY